MSKRRARLGWLRTPAACAASLVVAGVGLGSCIDRPISRVEPETTNLFVERVPTERVDKVDLLFVIDNSVSMADKQELLKEAVPELLRRLVEPLCTNGNQRVRPAPDGGCEAEFKREFEPIRDIHVGVITSSLGGSGSPACDPKANASNDDHGWLLGEVRPNLRSYDGRGFLVWDPDGKRSPPGTASLDTLVEDLKVMVEAVDETGCGYEAPLESWYRFLVQPDPPKRLEVVDGVLVPVEIDDRILAQRRAFLRPDSLVAIVMLSDENDCSVAVGSSGQYVGSGGRLPRGTAACEENPNDPCCRWCNPNETVAPPGCLPIAQDPVCAVSPVHELATDHGNLRCFDQRRRFGVDLLYPIQRYVEGLTQPLIPDRTGQLAPNPLFVDPANPNAFRRSRGLVFLAGILGVPWQDVATPESLGASGLEYLTAEELRGASRWKLLVGDRASNVAPSDPLMRESIDPRSDVHPIIGAPIVGAGASPLNPINGHDFTQPEPRDLQYACIYPLAQPANCLEADENGKPKACDCRDAPEKPLCRDPKTGEYGTTQHFAKAYPGRRQLEVLQGIEDQAIVASICPKVLDRNDPSYGYNPAVGALIERFAGALQGTCLPRDLAIDGELGTVPCKVVEAIGPSAEPLCNTLGRAPVDAALRTVVERELRAARECDVAPFPACRDLTLCEVTSVREVEGPEAARSCEQDATPVASGYCYVDPARGIGNPELVRGCGETQQRLVRLVSADQNTNPLPRNGATVYVACRGKAFE